MPTILTKRSNTPGAVPATANLTNAAGGAELAVNTADKRLFSINSSSAIIEVGTNPSSLTCADASFTVARVGSLTISSLSLTNVTVTSATVTTLTGTSANITNISGTSLTVSTATLSGGTANGVLYLNGSKVATSGSALVFDGSNLLIGQTTNTQNYRLVIKGSAGTADDLAFNSDATRAEIQSFNSKPLALNRQGNNVLICTDAGSVGIGTSSPTTPLDVTKAGGGNFVATFQNTTSATPYGVWIKDAATPTGGYPLLQVTNSAGSSVYFRVDSSTGNVGIGTSSPEALLSVSKSTSGGEGGYIWIDNPATSVLNNKSGIKFGTSSGASFASVPTGEITSVVTNADDGASALTFGTFNGTSSSERARISSDGTFRVKGAGTAGSTDAFLVDGAAPASAARITSGGDFLVGKQAVDSSVAGCEVQSTGQYVGVRNGLLALFNRLTTDGDLISFRQDGTEEGSISVSGNTVSYNAFAGSHWSQLQDGSKPDILRGTVMESINELCVWPGEQNERLPKSKISDTAGSKKVYGVFMAWDNDWTETNDMYVTAVGAFICRVNASVTVQEGDLLESNGDGTARVQADDIIRSSTIGKVTSTVKTHQYADGSYCVPTVLYCG